jgi:hypothetical protein
MTINAKALLDLPFYEPCNQAPVVTQAIAGICTSEDGSDRFIYYLSGITFYRYDTQADTWQLLAAPNQTPTVGVAMRFTKKRGYHGRVLSAASTTVQLPGMRGPLLNGQQIEILQGKGQGQTRTLTYVGETVHEAGVLTAAAANVITDNLKKMKPNQYAGYIVAITFGTDATQYKKILYNDATNIFVSDANLQPHDPWNNQPYAAILPYALPVAGSHYQIMSSQYSVSAWTVTPDYTSFFTTLSGGIYLVSSLAAAPFYSMQYYDVLSDSWQNKTTPQSMVLAALGTDFSIERTGKMGTALVTNLGAITGTARSLLDAGQTTLEVDRWRNHRIVKTSSTGIVESRRIVANTVGGFWVNRNWDTNPTSGDTYEVWPDYARIYLAGGAAAALFSYSTFNDAWEQGQYFDDGVVANISCTYGSATSGWTALGVTSGTRIALGVQVLASAPVAAGTGYAIGDTFSFVTGTGAAAKGRVTGITTSGAITSVELLCSGTTTGYATGTSGALTNIIGTGSAATVSVTTVGPTAEIVLATAGWMKQGDQVAFAGCTDATWNATYTILGVSVVAAAGTTFSVATTAAANMAATASQSVTTLVDPTKNWVVNEHAGRILDLCVFGTAPTSQKRWIVSNTATVLTVAAMTAGIVGTSKYTIYDANIFGCDDQRKEAGMSGFGHASGGSTTQLTDASKNWIPNQWVGYYFKVEAGTGYGTGRIAITASNATTITYGAQGFTPDATTRYEIADGWGLATSGAASTLTDTQKNWAVNQWINKRVRFTAGTLMGTETVATANTATAITITGTPDATTAYAILSVPAKGAGFELIWTWGATNSADKKKMYCPRGGGQAMFDIYDIASELWTFAPFVSPQAEPYAAGASYSYDGKDGIYLSRSTTGLVNRIFKHDITLNQTFGAGTTTWVQGTAHIGNFMEIINAPTTNEPYLYTLQNTGTLMSRALLF